MSSSAPGVGGVDVHFAIGVLKHAQAADAVDDAVGLGRGIGHVHAQQDEKAPADAAVFGAVDRDGRLGDAGDDGSHALPSCLALLFGLFGLQLGGVCGGLRGVGRAAARDADDAADGAQAADDRAQLGQIVHLDGDRDGRAAAVHVARGERAHLGVERVERGGHVHDETRCAAR